MKIISLMMLLSLVACGSGSDDSREKIDVTRMRLQYALENQEIACEGGQCPEYLVRVLAIDHYRGDVVSLSMCSGFLVDNNVVATNGHCIPEFMQFSGASCNENIFLVVKERSSSKGIVYRCDKVLSAFQKDVRVDLQDFAFLRVEQNIDRAPISIDSSGVHDNERTEAWVFNQHDAVSSTIKKKPCLAKMYSSNMPSYSDPKNPVVNLVDCPIIGGNSGSVLLGSNGMAKGIISHTSPGDRYTKRGKSPVQNALATSLACIDENFGYVKIRIGNCRRAVKSSLITPEYKQKVKDIFDAETTDGIALMVSSKLFEVPSYLMLKSKMQEGEEKTLNDLFPKRTYALDIDCFKSKRQEFEDAKNAVNQDYVSLHSLNVKLSFNQYLVPNGVKVEMGPEKSIRILVNKNGKTFERSDQKFKDTITPCT